jgi:peptide chain release factor subunit 1
MTWNRATHDHDVMAFEQRASLINGTGDGLSDIATDSQKHLLQDGGVQAGTSNSNFIETSRIADAGFSKFNAFSCRKATTNHQPQTTAISFKMNGQLSESPEPHGACFRFLWTKQATSKSDDMDTAHGSGPPRTCFHPIPQVGLHPWNLTDYVGGLKCPPPTRQGGKTMADDAKLSARRLRLKLALEDLREMKGFGTELVTLIIPPDRQISDARGMLQNEHGQAANIKSKGTRKNVQGAIESAISTLSRFKTPGENGLAIFVGSIIVGNNKTRMVNVVVDDPPQALISFRYRCDSRFELTQLEEMLIDKKSYALFVIDRAEAAYGIATGKRIHVQEHLVSNIMGKHRQGGQSAQRFERLIEEAAHNFFKRATEHANSYWLPHLENIQAVIIGGPGATKDFVVKNEYFHHEIAKKIAKTTFDVGYSNESGVRELVENAGALMGEIELDAERQVMNRFLEELIRPHPKATYGEKMINDALQQGAVASLLISEGLRGSIIELMCKKCNFGRDNDWEVRLTRNQELPSCPNCEASGDSIKELASHSIIDSLTQMAEASNTGVVYISTDTEEGSQLMQGFGGLAAILRYPLM